MNTTNFSLPFKGLGPQMTNAVEGSLQGMEVEIQDLEHKIEVAEGKTQAYYQEQMGDLCHTQEALQKELVGLREEGTD